MRPEVGKPAIATYPTKEQALDRARKDLGGRPEGGEVLAYNSRSNQLESLRVPGLPAAAVAAQPAPAANDVLALRDTVKREGEQIDKWLGAVLPLATAFGAAVVSPEVADAGGWFGVFIATLAWSLGWAFATYFVVSKSVQGVQTIMLVGLCFVVSIGIARVAGRGVLDVRAPSSGSPSGWVQWLSEVAAVAVLTYGWFGAVIGALVGLWLGHRFATHLSSDGAVR